MRMPDFPPTGLAASPLTACRVRFDASAAGRPEREPPGALAVALPVLAGPAEEIILADAERVDEAAGCTLFRAGADLAGYAVAPAELDLESAAHELYRRAFAATAGLRLCRIWNYVPAINATTAHLENYRHFCRGRSVAFEQHWGREFRRQLPSASAVGTLSGPLAIAFLGTAAAPQHFENPCQVPAFEYPPDYGPRPPSFSRATRVTCGGVDRLFISGTAAIRGHASVAPHDLDAQLPCTLENLQLIAQTAGAGAGVGRADGWQRSFKVYLRHGRDLERARAFLRRHLLAPSDTVSYLAAGICRADLHVEIEAVLTKPASP